MSDEHSDLPPHRLWQPTTAKWQCEAEPDGSAVEKESSHGS